MDRLQVVSGHDCQSFHCSSPYLNFLLKPGLFQAVTANGPSKVLLPTDEGGNQAKIYVILWRYCLVFEFVDIHTLTGLTVVAILRSVVDEKLPTGHIVSWLARCPAIGDVLGLERIWYHCSELYTEGHHAHSKQLASEDVALDCPFF